jgi:hypothetical protein
LIGAYAPGVAVRANLAQIGQVTAWVQQCAWNRANLDLIIDAGHIAQFPPQAVAALVVNECNQHIQMGSGWRSVTFAGASVPPDFGALPRGPSNIARVEWAAWQAIHQNVQGPIDYGDYGIAHPDMEEPPGFVMANATVSVKYTVDGQWIAIKGRPIGGANGQPMALQYRAHAQALAGDARFGQVPNCWGDGKITQIANSQINSGNRPMWVQLCANRHFAVVTHSLP